MARRGRVVLGLAALAVAVAGVLVFVIPGPPRNFHVVQEGVLYRSGQLTPAAFERVVRDRSIRTVVTLRPVRDSDSNSDAWEGDVCRTCGINHVRIAPPQERADGHESLNHVARAFLTVMDDPANHPVLVHCLAGRDRTGAMCAVYRMEYDRWAPERALEEMGIGGFNPDTDAAAAA